MFKARFKCKIDAGVRGMNHMVVDSSLDKTVDLYYMGDRQRRIQRGCFCCRFQGDSRRLGAIFVHDYGC